MFSEIKSKISANPRLFYAMSIAATWAGAGSFIVGTQVAQKFGLIPWLLWATGNTATCIVFGLLAIKFPKLRAVANSKPLQIIMGLMCIFQIWLNMNGIYEMLSPAGLRYISETDPQLWDRILKREPNAYLALLYWDSEMFHRSTNKRRKLEGTEPTKDYRALCKKILFEEPEKHFTNPKTKKVCQSYQRLYIKAYGVMEDKHFKRMYESVTAGDPKLRSLRAIYTTIYTDYLKKSKPSKKGGEK